MAIIHPKDAITIFKGGKMRKTVVRKRVRSPNFQPPRKNNKLKGWKNEKDSSAKKSEKSRFPPHRKNNKLKGWKNGKY